MATSHSLTTHCQTTLIKTLLASTVTHTDQRPELSYTPTYKMLAKRKKTYTLAWKWKSLSHVRLLVTPWTIQCKEFSRPEYWSIPVFQKPFPSPGDLPNPGIEPRSPILQVDSLPAEPQGKPTSRYKPKQNWEHTVKHICTTMFIAALFTIDKRWKQPKFPLPDGWISKLWYVYTT